MAAGVRRTGSPEPHQPHGYGCLLVHLEVTQRTAIQRLPGQAGGGGGALQTPTGGLGMVALAGAWRRLAPLARWVVLLVPLGYAPASGSEEGLVDTLSTSLTHIAGCFCKLCRLV